MPAVEKLSMALTADMAAAVRAAVASGDYASASEVIRDALRDWKQRRAAADDLRHLWTEGLASGPSEPLDMAAVKRRARARRADRDEPAA